MNEHQKGGKLEGAAVTDEVMESAGNLLDGRGNATKGLQQFYSPPQVAKFARRMLGSVEVADLTAGDGSLIAEFDPDECFAVEIDADQVGHIKAAGKVQGDLQHIAPILDEVNARFPAVALNPPFGLEWSDPSINDGRPVNSGVATLVYGLRLLDSRGSGLIVSGGDSGFDKALAEVFSWPSLVRDEGSYYYNFRPVPYAVISCPDIWAETRVANDITLFSWRQTSAGDAPNTARFEKHLHELADDDFIEVLRRLRREAAPSYRGWGQSIGENKLKLWARAAQEEYDRRTGQRIAKRTHEFDIYAVGKKLRVKLRPFTYLKLGRSAAVETLKALDKQPLTYFALNKKRWEAVLEMQENGDVAIDPHTVKAIQAVIDVTERELVPLYPIKPQQRLAWLEDEETILCTKDDKERGFVAGERYAIRVRPVKQAETERGRPVQNKKTGDIQLKDFRKERWVLQIRINGKPFIESKDDIEYLVSHFDIPDPGTIEDRFPEEVAAQRDILEQLEAGRSWKFKQFQKNDLSRLLVKRSGMIAWEQGLGKTLAGLAWAKALIAQQAAEEKVLLVAPQDLIPQWKREAKRFFGIELEWLRNQADFREANERLRKGGTGWFITHYEALSRTGKKESIFPLEMPAKMVLQETRAYSEWVWNEEKGHSEQVHHEARRWFEKKTRGEYCPNCGSSYRQGYNPHGTCEGKLPYDGSTCGWTPYQERVKPSYNLVKSTFRHGLLVIDELTMIKGDTSARSEALRGIKAKYVLGMTGTPIKNYVHDAFWGLWKCLGNATPRFPFDYEGGKREFTSQFCCIEWQVNGWGSKTGAGKILPEISHISHLWRLLAPNIIRRRKEETGEPLVKRTFYPTLVPLGVRQRRATELWLSSFGDFFREMNPDHNVVQAGMEDVMAAILGQLVKLEYAATMPEADPHKEYWVEKGKMEAVSNWTPKNCRVLELAIHHASKGQKVLIGSDLKAPGKWLHDELKSRGVKVENTLKNSDVLETLSPPARAKVVQKFQQGDAQVMVTTTDALNLGHNLDKGSVVILTGLCWDFATFDQFIARIHRLTSEREVSVYIVLAQGTIDERKWKLLVDKGSAASLALDGRLIEEEEKPINQQAILQQLIDAGVPSSGNEVLESDLEARWAEIKSHADLGEIVLDVQGVEDLNDLKEEGESDVPEEEAEGDQGDAPVPADVPAGDDATEAEASEPESEGPVAGEDAEAVSGNLFLGVIGRGSIREVEAYLYGENAIQWQSELPFTGKVAAIIEAPREGGFGAGPQSDRIRSSGSITSWVYETREEAENALAPLWDRYQAEEERALEAHAAQAEAEAEPKPKITFKTARVIPTPEGGYIAIPKEPEAEAEAEPDASEPGVLPEEEAFEAREDIAEQNEPVLAAVGAADDEWDAFGF